MAAPHFSSKDSGLRLRYSRALELIETLIDQTDELKGRVAFLEANAESANASVAKAQETSETIAKFREREESRLAKAQYEAEQMRATIATQQGEIAELNSKLSKAKLKYQQLSKDTGGAREKLRMLTEDRKRLQSVVASLSTVEADKTQLEKELNNMKLQMRNMHRQQAASATAQLQSLTKQLQLSLTAEQENVDKLKRQLAEACAERDDVSKENAQLRAFIEQLRAKIDELENREAGATFAKFVHLKNSNEQLADRVSKLQAKVSMKDMAPGARRKRGGHSFHAGSGSFHAGPTKSGRVRAKRGAAPGTFGAPMAAAAAAGTGALSLGGAPSARGPSPVGGYSATTSRRSSGDVRASGSSMSVLAPGGLRVRRG